MPSPGFQRQRLQRARLSAQVEAKWPLDLLREGYVPFPKRVIRALSQLYPNDTSIEELLVILAAADFRRPNLKQRPSVDFLAFTAGLSSERFAAALGRLIGKGWVENSGDDDALELSHEKLFSLVRERAREEEE